MLFYSLYFTTKRFDAQFLFPISFFFLVDTVRTMSAVRNDKGEWVIPASKRPDGTWRKEKVIKEGYVVNSSFLLTI